MIVLAWCNVCQTFVTRFRNTKIDHMTEVVSSFHAKSIVFNQHSLNLDIAWLFTQQEKTKEKTNQTKPKQTPRVPARILNKKHQKTKSKKKGTTQSKPEGQKPTLFADSASPLLLRWQIMEDLLEERRRDDRIKLRRWHLRMSRSFFWGGWGWGEGEGCVDVCFFFYLFRCVGCLFFLFWQVVLIVSWSFFCFFRCVWLGVFKFAVFRVRRFCSRSQSSGKITLLSCFDTCYCSLSHQQAWFACFKATIS